MPVVAIVDGIKIQFYNDEHPPAHFHAEFAEYKAMIGIDSLEIIVGYLPRPQYRKVRAWARTRQDALLHAWFVSQSDLNPEKIL